MFARPAAPRNPLTRLAPALAGAALALLAACTDLGLPTIGGPGASSAGGPRIDPSAPVPVALLVPRGDSGGGGVIGRSMENAARLADTTRLDLRIYDTGGTPTGASAAATQALSEGAQIVLGPLFTQSTTAVTAATAGQNVNVLSFSNNEAVAGGNVFVLGQTFSDIAGRLTAYARGQGRSSVAIVHGEDVAGAAGRDAIAAAAGRSGMTVATVQSYPLSQEGIIGAGPRIGGAVTASGADTVFLTANVDADLPLIATALPENGVSPGTVQYLGLTRWGAAAQAASLPGLQGGLFARPDADAVARFERRYAGAYGSQPHPLAGLAFDAVTAVDTLVAEGRADALTGRALTRREGFQGAAGSFRLLPDGTNNRALAVAQIRDNQVTIVDPAPSRFGAAGL